MNTPLRIFHLLDHSLPLHSGYSFRTEAIVQNQRALGWSTMQLTSPKQGAAAAPSETVAGITYERSPPLSWPWRRLPVVNQLAVSATLRRAAEPIIDEWRPHLLQAHSSALNGLAGLKLARRFGLPLVYELRAFWEDAAVDHGTTREGSLRYRLTRALETHVVRQADAVTTICEGIRGDLIERGVAPEKITVIPNAVDMQQFGTPPAVDDALAEQLGVRGRTVLGFIGSFYAYEGLDLLLSAFATLRQEHSNAVLLLVGGGYQDQTLRQQAARLGVADHVIFTGRVAHNEVNRYYDLVDIFVYPRHRMRLTELVTPLKPLEAMARGRLVVASDVGGHRELIEDGVTGTLFEAGNAEALSAAVGQLLQQRELWPQRIAAARQFVERERSWPVSVRGYEDIYRRLLAAR